jgi:hypothetical protein
VGCGNRKRIPLDTLLAAPGASGALPPIHCVKNDEDAEGALRVVATTTDGHQQSMPIGVGGLKPRTVLYLPYGDLRELFEQPIADHLFPVQLFVMGRALELQIDTRGRIE